MKSVIFITTLPIWSLGTEGKGGAAFYNTLRKYIDEGWDTYLVSDESSNGKYDYVDGDHNIVVQESRYKKYTQVRKLGFIFRITNHILTTVKYEHAAEKIITGLQRNRPADKVLLYAYEVAAVDACKKLSEKYNIPLVTRFQGTVLSRYRYNGLNEILRYPAYQALRTKADLIIMTDDGTQGDRVLCQLENKSHTLFLKNGLQLLEDEIEQINFKDVRESYGIAKDDLLFLTASRLTGWKKVNRAIEGFKSYIELGGNGRLMIVGDGDKKQELATLADSFGIRDKVIFTGSLAQKDVYSCMYSCDVFLSLYDLSNVGNPLLEAMCLGCAIITLDVGDTRTVIDGRNGILLKLEDLGKLGKEMYRFFKDSSLSKKYGSQAKEYARSNLYSWKQRMNIEYEEVLKLMEK